MRDYPDDKDWLMEELENVGHEATYWLRAREQHWIEQVNPTLNMNAAELEVAA
jgi:hypothetical protein